MNSISSILIIGITFGIIAIISFGKYYYNKIKKERKKLKQEKCEHKDTYTSFDPYIHKARVYCSDCDKLVNNLNFKKAIKEKALETRQKFNNEVDRLIDRLENTSSESFLEAEESDIHTMLIISNYVDDFKRNNG